MTLHIFNPEHDIALASGLANFTAPHAGSRLRHDLGWLPLLWAQAGDCVLVDDKDAALRGWQRLCARLAVMPPGGTEPSLTTWRQRGDRVGADAVSPWGWDAALRAALQRRGVAESLMPTEGQATVVRQLSHRSTAARLLPLLRFEGTVGEAWACTTMDETVQRIDSIGRRVVLKAPWSSSGRGLRFVESSEKMLPNVASWVENVLKGQGNVMVEPYYNKVKDFGMEFMAHADGRVSYEGLSLFSTKNGAYTGNLLATETHKRQLISRYVSQGLLNEVARRICSHMEQVLKEAGVTPFVGPFGADMMVVAAQQGQAPFLLHPCVEINLRRTMGHVALALTPLVNPKADDEVVRVMRIALEDNQYKLKIERL